MATITHKRGQPERYLVGSPGPPNEPWKFEDRGLTLAEVRLLLEQGLDLALYVDGWTDPWSCWIDGAGHIRAQCPTAPGAVPRIEEVEMTDSIFDLLSRAVKARRLGHEVIAADRPPDIGFVDEATGDQVLLSLAVVKREIDERPDRDWADLGLEGDQVYEAFKTAPGRQKLFGGLR